MNFDRERHHEATDGSEEEHVRGDRDVGDVEELRQARALGEDRHRLFVADDRDRHDRYAGAHRDLDEATAAEATELVALARELPGALRALGEHEHELLLVVQQAVRVVGVRRNATGARPQRADDRQRAEQVVGEPVDGPAELGLDAVHDHRRVRRDRTAVVGDEERAALPGQVLEALPLDAEPVAVDRVVQAPGEAAHLLAATPAVDVAGPHAVIVVGRGLRTGDRHQLAAGGRCGGVHHVGDLEVLGGVHSDQ